MGREASGGENHGFGYIWVWFSVRFVGAAGNKEYEPGGVWKRKSSIWIRLDMVFCRVRGGGRKQGIWAGRRRAAKIIDLGMLDYGFP